MLNRRLGDARRGGRDGGDVWDDASPWGLQAMSRTANPRPTQAIRMAVKTFEKRNFDDIMG